MNTTITTATLWDTPIALTGRVSYKRDSTLYTISHLSSVAGRETRRRMNAVDVRQKAKELLGRMNLVSAPVQDPMT